MESKKNWIKQFLNRSQSVKKKCTHQDLKTFTHKNSLTQTKNWRPLLPKNELRDIQKNTFLSKCTKCLMPGFKPVITGWQDKRLTRFSQTSFEISMENLPVEITDVNWNNKGIMSLWVNPPTRWQLITPNATTPFKDRLIYNTC